MIGVRVEPEGREGVWIPVRDDLVSWLESSDEPVHCFIGTPIAFIGADWDRRAVIREVLAAERVALLTGESKRGNMNHALAVIRDNELHMFDVGEVDDVIMVAPGTTAGSACLPDPDPVSRGAGRA